MFSHSRSRPVRSEKSAQTVTRRSGSGYGKGRSMMPSTTLKIAVLAPIPRPKVRTMTVVKPGFLIAVRTAKLASRNNVDTMSPRGLEGMAESKRMGTPNLNGQRKRGLSERHVLLQYQCLAAMGSLCRTFSSNASAMSPNAASRTSRGSVRVRMREASRGGRLKRGVTISTQRWVEGPRPTDGSACSARLRVRGLPPL